MGALQVGVKVDVPLCRCAGVLVGGAGGAGGLV